MEYMGKGSKEESLGTAVEEMEDLEVDQLGMDERQEEKSGAGKRSVYRVNLCTFSISSDAVRESSQHCFRS